MKLKIYIIFFALLVTVISGCGKDPIANAGEDQTVVLGETAILSGAASDKETGESLTYSWSIVSAPEGSQAQLSDANAMEPTFTPDIDGEYIFQLIVNNGWNSEPAQVKITCTPAPETSTTETSTTEESEDIFTDPTGTIHLLSLSASEINRTDTDVNFSLIFEISNTSESRVNFGFPVQGKDSAGNIVFSSDFEYALDPLQTIEMSVSYGSPLTIAEYDSITTWTIGEIVIYQ